MQHHQFETTRKTGVSKPVAKHEQVSKSTESVQSIVARSDKKAARVRGNVVPPEKTDFPAAQHNVLSGDRMPGRHQEQSTAINRQSRTKSESPDENSQSHDYGLWVLVGLLTMAIAIGLYFVSNDHVDENNWLPGNSKKELASNTVGHTDVGGSFNTDSKAKVPAKPEQIIDDEVRVVVTSELLPQVRKESSVEYEETVQVVAGGVTQKQAKNIATNADSSFNAELEGFPDKIEQQYHASIGTDEEGLVIVLNSPEEELLIDRLMPTDKADSLSQQHAEQVVAMTESEQLKGDGIAGEKPLSADNSLQHKSVKSLKHSEVEKKASSTTVVHIVVKGDTLWHIAKRYINNPYRYPELARLSRIKNPDLIYPGDRVKIIINKYQSEKSHPQ